MRSISVGNVGDRVLDGLSITLASGGAPELSLLQNGCLDPLEPGASCSLSVQFLPRSPGSFMSTLRVDAGAAGEASVALSGAALSAGALLVTASEGSSPQFGDVLIGQSSEATFTVLNPSATASGPLTLGINNPDLSLLAPAAGDCVPGVTALAPGESCTVHVAFAPTRREASEAVLTITSAAVGSTGLRLDGIGTAPGALEAEGEVSVQAVLGQAAQVSITIHNAGDQTLSLAGARVEPGSPEVDYTLVQSTCSGELAGGASCQVVIEFKPNGLGPRPATLLITPASGDPLQVAIGGEGLKPGALVVTPVEVQLPPAGAAVDYGPVPRAGERVLTFRVQNPGATSSGLLGPITATGDFAVLPTQGTSECDASSTLVAGQTCDLRVRFSPLQRGLREGSLTVVSVAAGSVALALRGTGTVPANISAEPANVQLGSAVLGETRSAVVTLRNDGDEAATAPLTQLTGPGAEAFAVSGCGAALDPGASCELAVQFRPTNDPAHTGLLTPTLQITSAAGGSASVALTARGLRPGSIDISPAGGASTAFQAAVGGTQTQVFNISNSGGIDSGALTVSIANPGGRRDFELGSPGLATACQTGQVLPPGSTCSIGVTFRPGQAGINFGATLSAASSAAGTDSIALTGVAQALATLSSPAAVASFPSGAASPEFAWRIDNNGDIATGPLTLGPLPPGFALGTTGTCPFNQATGLPAHSSCTVPVRFAPQQQPIQGQDQVVQGTLSVSAGPLSVRLGVTGTIPRALAGRGQVCARDSDCQPGRYSICGSSGSNDLPNVCCDSACNESPCNGCTAGPSGGTCSPLPLQSACVTNTTSRAGLCLQGGTCTEFCILDQSTLDECLLAD